MAKKTAAAGTSTTPAEAKPPRKERDTENSIRWDGARDDALIDLVLSNPNKLTTQQICQALATHPAFAGDGHLFGGPKAVEKVRQHIKKVSTKAEKQGLPPLPVRRLSTSGYDMDQIVAAAYARYGVSVGAAAGGVQGTITATPVAQPPVPVGGFGGLIPTP